MKFKAKEKGTVKGEYVAVSLAPWVERGSKIVDDIRFALRTKNQGILQALIDNGAILRISEATNIIPTTGRNVLARLIAGDVTYTGEVDYGAIGDAVSPSFNNASTYLGSEQFRSQADSQA